MSKFIKGHSEQIKGGINDSARSDIEDIFNDKKMMSFSKQLALAAKNRKEGVKREGVWY